MARRNPDDDPQRLSRRAAAGDLEAARRLVELLEARLGKPSLLEALRAFVAVLDSTDGIPSAWPDLDLAYEKACDALGRAPLRVGGGDADAPCDCCGATPGFETPTNCQNCASGRCGFDHCRDCGVRITLEQFAAGVPAWVDSTESDICDANDFGGVHRPTSESGRSRAREARRRSTCRVCGAVVDLSLASQPPDGARRAGTDEDPRAPGDRDDICDECDYGDQRGTTPRR